MVYLDGGRLTEWWVGEAFLYNFWSGDEKIWWFQALMWMWARESRA